MVSEQARLWARHGGRAAPGPRPTDLSLEKSYRPALLCCRCRETSLSQTHKSTRVGRGHPVTGKTFRHCWLQGKRTFSGPVACPLSPGSAFLVWSFILVQAFSLGVLKMPTPTHVPVLPLFYQHPSMQSAYGPISGIIRSSGRVHRLRKRQKQCAHD